MPTHYLGVDVGGSGVKAARVDLKKGVLLTERVRVPTPQPATPDAVAAAVAHVARGAGWDGGPLGCTVPARVRNGVVETAANIDPAWIGTRADKLFRKRVEGATVVAVLNDADAAGLAEMRWGAGRGATGTTLMLTFGTGIGSALFVGSTLVPNVELGHIRYDDHRIAEHVAADSVRQKQHLTWERWARQRVQPVLAMYEFLFAPDRIIVGGGVSHPDKWALFGHLLHMQARLVPAELGNEAGIIGAAWQAKQLAKADAR